MSSVAASLIKYGVIYVTEKGNVISKGEYPFLSNTPSATLVYFTGTEFVCPRNHKTYKPPVIIVSVFGISYVEHGDLSVVSSLGGLVVWVGDQPSDAAHLDIIFPHTLGS